MKPLSLCTAITLLGLSFGHAQSLWVGPDQGDWNRVENWSPDVPTHLSDARFLEDGEVSVKIDSPSKVRGIQKDGLGNVTLEGDDITLGEGYSQGFNSILVNAGGLTINNTLINSANKRITLNEMGDSLTINGDIHTGGVTTQIGNLGSGELSFNGDRTGANALYIVDGEVQTTGILSNQVGGNTQVFKGGIVRSAKIDGPSIERGSIGLALRENGTFVFAADNQIAGYIHFARGTLDLNGHTNDEHTIGNLTVSEDSIIDFSDPAAESLLIKNVSNNLEWIADAVLNIQGFGDGDTLRFGDDSSGLTAEQLLSIQFDGTPAQIDGAGYITPKN